MWKGMVFWGEVSKGIQKKQGENKEAIEDDAIFSWKDVQENYDTNI